MQRYFGSIIQNNVLLSEEDEHHLVRVNRTRVGEQIEIVCDGMTFLAEVKSVKPLQIDVINKIKEQRELPCEVILVAALLKGDKLDFVMQKATELGVGEVVLLSTKRTIVKTKDYNSEKKLARFNHILKEAAEQSRRNRIPTCSRFITIDKLSNLKGTIKMIAYEEVAGSTKSLWSSLKEAKKDDRIIIVIGPEGGFEPSEVKVAEEQGFIPVSLGNRVLRAETASIYALSVISSYLERK